LGRLYKYLLKDSSEDVNICIMIPIKIGKIFAKELWGVLWKHLLKDSWENCGNIRHRIIERILPTCAKDPLLGASNIAAFANTVKNVLSREHDRIN
jgi:hypothetical protein